MELGLPYYSQESSLASQLLSLENLELHQSIGTFQDFKFDYHDLNRLDDVNFNHWVRETSLCDTSKLACPASML